MNWGSFFLSSLIFPEPDDAEQRQIPLAAFGCHLGHADQGLVFVLRTDKGGRGHRIDAQHQRLFRIRGLPFAREIRARDRGAAAGSEDDTGISGRIEGVGVDPLRHQPAVHLARSVQIPDRLPHIHDAGHCAQGHPVIHRNHQAPSRFPVQYSSQTSLFSVHGQSPF